MIISGTIALKTWSVLCRSCGELIDIKDFPDVVSLLVEYNDLKSTQDIWMVTSGKMILKDEIFILKERIEKGLRQLDYDIYQREILEIEF